MGVKSFRIQITGVFEGCSGGGEIALVEPGDPQVHLHRRRIGPKIGNPRELCRRLREPELLEQRHPPAHAGGEFLRRHGLAGESRRTRDQQKKEQRKKMRLQGLDGSLHAASIMTGWRLDVECRESCSDALASCRA